MVRRRFKKINADINLDNVLRELQTDMAKEFDSKISFAQAQREMAMRIRAGGLQKFKGRIKRESWSWVMRASK